MMNIRSKISGTGLYAPKKVFTNDDLKQFVETSHEWIFERSGIAERHVADFDEGETPSGMAAFAGKMAIERAHLTPNDIDFIIFASTSPDYKLPNSAILVQEKLGITNNCGCVDIAAACTGFVYGASMADALIRSGIVKNVLVIGSEVMTKQVDWKDRSTCVLFGDGAGAAVISKTTADDPAHFISHILQADARGREFFHQKIGAAVHPLTKENIEDPARFMQMKGKEMFRSAVRTMADAGVEVLRQANLKLEDVQWVVAHQANLRIIEATAERLGVGMDKFIVNIDRYANTSAATIPIAFHEAVESGKIQRGDLILFVAFGAGLTSGASLLRF